MCGVLYVTKFSGIIILINYRLSQAKISVTRSYNIILDTQISKYDYYQGLIKLL